MHQGFRRSVGATCAAALLTASLAVAGQWWSADTASADPQAVAKAQAKLDRIEEERAALDAEYAASQENLDDATAELKVVNADLTRQGAKVSTMRTSISAVALQQFQTSGTDLAARLLTSSDDASFLDQVGRVESVTTRANDQLLDFQLAKAELTQLQGTAAATLSTIKVARDQQATLLTKLTAKEDEAAKVLTKLTAQEKARLAAIEAEKARKAAAAAARVASTSRSRTSASMSVSDLPVAASGRAAQALAFARAQVGKSYVYGATGPNAYDCSGLTGAAYRSAGISLPRTARAQFGVGQRVSLGQLQPGDLVFYYSGISHVGMYVGNGMIVHAANPRSGITYASVTSMPFMGGRRVG